MADMAVVLAYGSPALGHLFPLISLLSELTEREHRVHLRTMAAGVAEARAEGIDVSR
jgi:UDP:flavonoid glycosyltransferase YjiC (YdhE family)